MRVALLIGSAQRGGAEGQLVRLASEMTRQGHDVRVFFLAKGGPLTEVLDEAGVPWTVLNDGRRPGSDTLRVVWGVVRWMAAIARWQPEIVHAWLPSAVALGLPTARLVTRARRVAAFRGQVPVTEVRSSTIARLLKSGVRRSDSVTINAAWLAREAAIWGARADRITLIPNAVTIPERQSRPGQTPATAVVVANFHAYKGHDVLLEALALLEDPPLVRLIGTGSLMAATRESVRRLGLDGVVTLVEAPADVQGELAAAQFAIHPSRTEGMSNAILEEIAAGLPVVATAVGAAAVMVSDGESGYLVPAGEAAPLAAAIGRVAADPSLRISMGAAAHRQAQAFSWKECAAQTLGLYASLIPDA